MNDKLILNDRIFNNPFQGKIYELLETLVGKGTAGYYRDACRLVNINSTFETTTNLVFHLLREIESALRDVLNEIVEEKSEGRICKECKRPFNLSHKEQIKRILRVLEPSNSSNLPKDWLAYTEDQERLSKYAHRSNLNPSKKFDESMQKRFEKFQVVLYEILNLFEAHYIKIVNNISELAKSQNPTEKDLNRLFARFPNKQEVQDTFFYQLSSPKWMQLLINIDFFRKPPEPIVLERGTSFPQV